MPTIYRMKPRFQRALRPLVDRLATTGATANQVTVLGGVLSLGYGAALALSPPTAALWSALPLVLFARMALNAIDGMLAREHRQASRLGCYLNELADLAGDMALYLPFALLSPDRPWIAVLAVQAAVLAETAGILGQATGVGRRYDGPMGKSDRAAAFGILGLAVGVGIAPGPWLDLAIAAIGVLSLVTAWRRIAAQPVEQPS